MSSYTSDDDFADWYVDSDGTVPSLEPPDLYNSAALKEDEALERKLKDAHAKNEINKLDHAKELREYQKNT